ncbi:cation:proton antiporter family protein [Pseudomonas leptonychotis]|uniref:Sodium:proton exchanger n=1 Tax=Pseudomonas leptonychotis TaxID=2448482 RepID=A0A4T1ZSQ8_9PSED|nr:cation:proton antiporter family protein [Pseudomonas leptonychotis]TIH06399.1 sodium:proton exchanger [Pseudomonas leptonychotis]
MIEAAWIAFAFAMGLAARAVGLPPLVGYLGAGFALAAVGERLGIDPHESGALQHIAHLGVLLLLFTVGLKLKASNLLRREVFGGGLLHFAISSVVFLPAILLLLELPWYQCLLLAIALSFSSTVLAAKVLESKRELRAFHGRVAIGVLVIQDMIALLVMSLAAGDLPSPWALLVFGLPLLRPLLFRLLDASGHEELMLLLGLMLALVAGGYGFEQLGLSAELGALAFGALLAKHKRATELSNSLWGIKEVFLVGFFLQIGMGGLPDADALIFALVMTLLLPLKGVLFFFLFLLFRLRARSAFLTSVSLTNYSEFGLIMASVVMPQWLIPLAITVALSFVISAPLNRIAHPLYERFARRLIPLERNIRHPDEQPLSLGDTQTLVMGMGRTGRAAYDYLKEQGYRVVGLDSDPVVIEQGKVAGRRVLFADGEDPVFWQHLDMSGVDAVILTLNDEETKVIATQKLRERGFSGLVVSHALYEDMAKRIQEAGADRTYLTMSEAGSGLAEHVIKTLERNTEAS